MLRLAILFVLTILIIPHIQSQTGISDVTEQTSTEETNSSDTEPTAATSTTVATTSTTVATTSTTAATTSITAATTSTTAATTSTTEEPTAATSSITDDTGNDTTVPFSSSTDSVVTTTSVTYESTTTTTLEDSTTAEPLSSESWSETSEQASTTSITSTVITSATTESSLTPFYYCDFTNSSCFGNGELIVTNGSEFNPPILSYDTPPPIAPLSDVTSIVKPTNNGNTCVLPYHPSLDNNSTESISWNMSFCYNQTCPTGNEEYGTCASGNYGLISLNASETSKTVSNSFYSTNVLRDSIVEQRLRFYYYFTVYENQSNWNQQIQIWLKPDNQTDYELSLVNLTINDMIGNEWRLRELTFQSASENYTLEFVFKIDVEIPEFNETIYFALDNIELDNIDYPYTTETNTDSGNSTTPLPITTPVPTTHESGTKPPGDHGDWTVIVGLSLGIGIPVLLIIIGGFVLYKKKDKNVRNYDIPLKKTGPREDGDVFDNPLLF